MTATKAEIADDMRARVMPLRVLHASPTWFASDSVVGGGERWVDNVMRALDAAAPNITQAMTAIGAKPRTLLRRRAVVRILANERRLESPMAAISSQLWNEIEPFDIVHVHQSLTDFGAYTACVAASLGKTVVLTDLGGGSNPIMLNGGLAMGDGIVSISEYAHQTAAALYDQLPHLIARGPVDTDVFRPAERPPIGPAVICVSRIMPHKGIDRLIRALPAGLKLRVVGRVYHENYHALLKSLASGKNVEFVHDPTDDQLVELYQHSTIFVQASCSRDVYGTHVSKTELMGLTTIEAMACGLPVIVSSDGGALPELITDTRFGFVFSDEHELALRLMQHQAGIWPSPEAGKLARACSESAYSLRAFGRRLADFYVTVHRTRLDRQAACES
jgi:glycosyltransferase involved in cell wall biosynthesis